MEPILQWAGESGGYLDVYPYEPEQSQSNDLLMNETRHR
jgi:hypothetical protein